MKARPRALGLVAVLVAAATMAATTGAAGMSPTQIRLEGQGNMTTGSGDVVLRKTVTLTEPVKRAIKRSVATKRIGPPVSLRTVLRDTTTAQVTRQSGGVLRWKSACGHYDDVLKRLDKKKRVGAWCWDSTDQTSVTWVPQGVTSTAESSANGRSQGQTAMAATWYRRTHTDKSSRGIRVSLFPTPKTGKGVHYNHVALVVPSVDSAGMVNFTDLRIHAGGVAWNGNYLYVPDTSWGIRVFDVRTIHPVAIGTRTGSVRGGAMPSVVDARYAMMQVASYRVASTGCRSWSGLPPCFSSLSIDRSLNPPRVVVSEYLSPADYKRFRRGASVVGWDLGPDGLPLVDEPANPSSRTATSDQVLVNFTHSVQGALVNEAAKEIYSSSSNIDNGWLYYEKDADGRVPRLTTEWPAGAQSLSRWYGTGKIISLTERVHRRMVFTVMACELRGGNKRCK